MLRHWFHQRIDSIPCQKGVSFVSTTTLTQAYQAVAALENLPTHVAIVEESGRFIGSLNTNRLLREVIENDCDDGASLAKFSESASCIDVRETLEDALEFFGTHSGQTLAVCRDGIFCGFITANDLMQFMWRSEFADVSQLSAEVNQFVSYVAHDMGNPLTVILLASGMLLQNSEWDEARETQLQMIQRAAKQSMRISDELVLSERYAKTGTVISEPMRLSQFMEEVYSDNVELVRFKGFNLVVEHCDEGDICIDPRLMRRALLNLIDNACKHSSKGSDVCLSARFANAERSAIEFVIRDHGRGIDPAYLTRIFEPFVQGSKTMAGYGLGLMIVKRFVDLHGGRVWTDGGIDTGAKFIISIPQ